MRAAGSDRTNVYRREEGILPGIIARLTGWVVGVYYDFEREGTPLPTGPVLVVANHPNALVDPIVVFRTARRVVRPLAKAPLFEQALLGSVLRGLGGLPVYRRQDDPALVHLNETTFDLAIAALHRGEAVQIFPEGQSHSEPRLTPLRTGAARIALLAEDRAGWTLGLQVVPVGLTNVRKHLFRGRALATVGGPFGVSPWREAYAADPQEAARLLTDEITRRLQEVTLNLEDARDRALVEVAERLYVREKGWVRWRERERLGERLPRLQAFARGVSWLRAQDPRRHAALVRDVERYGKLLAVFGAEEGDVPPRYAAGPVLGYALAQASTLLLLALPAAAGVVSWWLPYQAPRVTVRLVRPTLDAVATYKLATALFAFPVTGALWALLAWWWGGREWALAAAVGLPLSGAAAIAFVERARVVREDLRVFLRARRSGEGAGRLAGIRARLVEEFDRVAEEMTSDAPPAG